MVKKTRPTRGLPLLVGGAVIVLFLAISITAPQSQENNDPRTEPIPTFDAEDPSKATLLNVTFNGPDEVQVNSISVVRQRPPGAGGNPPLLLVEVVDQAGTVLLQFNEWNPLHTRVYDDGDHSHQIADTASMTIAFPFDVDHSRLRINDIEREVQLLEVDLEPAIDEFCRANPLDPDCTMPSADLSVLKTDDPDPVFAGNNLTYMVTVTNNGPDEVPAVTLSDSLPAGVNLNSVTPSQGTCTGTSTVNCQLGRLANGASATVAIVVVPTAGGIITNAVITGTVNDSNLGNNVATQNTEVLILIP